MVNYQFLRLFAQLAKPVLLSKHSIVLFSSDTIFSFEMIRFYLVRVLFSPLLMISCYSDSISFLTFFKTGDTFTVFVSVC